MNSVMTPAVVIRPSALVVPWSVNQRLPSGPGAIPLGRLPGLRPVPERSDHPARRDAQERRAGTPIGDPHVAVCANGERVEKLPAGRANEVIVPSGAIRPIAGVPVSVNQKLPSAPTRTCRGRLVAGRLYPLRTVPLVDIRPIPLAAPWSENQRLPSAPDAIRNGTLPAGTVNVVTRSERCCTGQRCHRRCCGDSTQH